MLIFLTSCSWREALQTSAIIMTHYPSDNALEEILEEHIEEHSGSDPCTIDLSIFSPEEDNEECIPESTER